MQEDAALRGQKILELSEELWQMPGYKLYQEIQGLDLSIYTFHKNYVALNTILTFLTSDERADGFFALKNRDKFSAVGKDVICYLHNYVASAMSLIDHTRNLYKRLYVPKKQFPDYQDRVTAEFAKDPLAQFVVCLRQYCQHYKAPNISVRTTFPNGFTARPVRKVLLAVTDLRTFDRWNREALAYLQTIQDAVDIHAVANSYRNKVMNFYQWINMRQGEMHAVEFEEFKVKERELLLLQLDTSIENYFTFNHNKHMSKHDVFINILSAEDFRHLDQISAASHELAQIAIALTEKNVPLSDGIKEKIFRLYDL